MVENHTQLSNSWIAKISNCSFDSKAYIYVLKCIKKKSSKARDYYNATAIKII